MCYLRYSTKSKKGKVGDKKNKGSTASGCPDVKGREMYGKWAGHRDC